MPLLNRRDLLKSAIIAPTATALATTATPPAAEAGLDRVTGAEAVTLTLQQEGVGCVYGIPGAQENELWDTFKTRGLPYLLVTHEFSAACMADGYARATGQVGVLCVVPGPGLTNSLSGLGEALLDSVPVVCIVGDVARGDRYRPFQVHALDGAALLRPVTKQVFEVTAVSEIPAAIRQAFAVARAGEPGPTAVVIPWNLLIEAGPYRPCPRLVVPTPFDEAAYQRAVAILANRNLRVGIYAGYGCMDYAQELTQVAELLQAPVATSMSGKGAIAETHPLAVGWGFGPHARTTAEQIFAGRRLRPGDGVDCVLAVGVKFSEVSTGFYSNPQPRLLIHVDAEPRNINRILRTDVCVQADAGEFFRRLLAQADCLRRAPDAALQARIAALKCAERHEAARPRPTRCGIDPMQTILALREAMPSSGLLFVDVTISEHLATEAFTACQPRTYFIAADNQSMGWSIPAAIGAQRVLPDRTVATLTGDGCLLMSGLEISTAAREGLPVKWFILDNRVYHYMQMLQNAAYRRTTATVLAQIDYRAFAQAMGVAYRDISDVQQLRAGVDEALRYPGPVLVRVATDPTDRPIRWVEAVRRRFTEELSAAQKLRFLARIAARSVDRHPQND